MFLQCFAECNRCSNQFITDRGLLLTLTQEKPKPKICMYMSYDSFSSMNTTAAVDEDYEYEYLKSNKLAADTELHANQTIVSQPLIFDQDQEMS